MTDDPRIDSTWQKALAPAWKNMVLPTGTHLDDEIAAAYAEGHLADGTMRTCDEHLSQCPDCLALVEELWKHLDANAADGSSVLATLPKHAEPLLSHPYILAASLLLAVSGWAWHWYDQGKSAQLLEANVHLQDQLADAHTELILGRKEDFIEATPSPVNSYWAMTTSPKLLQTPQTRGRQPPTPESSARAERVRQVLQRMLNLPESRGWAFLELASVEIIAGRMAEADEALRQARQLLGGTPAVKNVSAVQLMAKGDKESVAKAEQVLLEAIRDDPEYLPARYNLALLLQQSFRDAESRTAWHDYLSREQRPDYREAAKAQMSALQELPEGIHRKPGAAD